MVRSRTASFSVYPDILGHLRPQVAFHIDLFAKLLGRSADDHGAEGPERETASRGMKQEIEEFERWLGDLFDELFGPGGRCSMRRNRR